MDTDTNQVIPKPQQGAVLVVSLMMLLLLTLVGTAGMRVTTLEEKMAGNMRDRNLAFQAAEAALIAGESYFSSALYDRNNFCGAASVGLFDALKPACDGTNPVWENISWNDTDSIAFNGVLSNLSANPRYIIEDMGCLPAPSACPGPHNYRITARATGGTADTVVILQSIFQF